MILRKKIVIIIISLLAVIQACNNTTKEKSTSKTYSEPPPDKLDSLTKWFSNTENYKNEQFISGFNSAFNTKINLSQLEEAAALLYYVGQSVYINRKADKDLINTHVEFIKKHEKEISDRYRSGLYLNLGILYYYNSDFELSKQTLTKVTQIPYKDFHTLTHLATAYNELSYSFNDEGIYDKSIEMAFKALEHYEMLNDTLGVGTVYDALGALYYSINDISNADLFFDKAIVTLNSTSHEKGVFEVYLNKLDMYEETNNPKLDSVIDLVYKYYIEQQLNNDFYKLNAYSWKTQNLIKEKKYKEAQKILNELKPIFDNSEEKFLYYKYIDVATELGKIIGKKTIDAKIYRDAIPEFKTKNNLRGLLSCYYALENEALEMKDYKKAYYYTEAYNELYDSLSSKSLIIKTKELDKKYQVEKKERQIALQKSQLTQKNTFIALLFATIALLFLAIMIFNYIQKQKVLKKEKSNNLRFTKQLIENTEEERKRIACDLHDSISHELLNLKSFFKQDLNTINTKIDSIINDIRGISRNLHPVMFDKIGLEPNIKQLVERIQDQNDFLVSTNINYKGSLKSADELQLYRIIQEALTNIIKYAQAHAAKLTFIEDEHAIFLEIKDNGKGFDVQEVLNSGKAFGLHNIIERSRVIGGKASILSTASGTTITIKIVHKVIK